MLDEVIFVDPNLPVAALTHETAEAHHQRDLSCVPHCSHWKTVASLSTGVCFISPPHAPPLPRLLMQLGRSERASSLVSRASESVTLAALSPRP